MSVDFSMPVLVVDDSSTTGRIITGLLKQIGFKHVDLVPGGHTALTKIRKIPYGLIISDWNMTPISGLDLLRTIRAESAFRKVRFIIMTAEASTDHVTAAKAAGVDHFIVKPFTVSVLKAKIDSIFDDSSQIAIEIDS
jgi:two-component system chemotaxis response regulator CheY